MLGKAGREMKNKSAFIVGLLLFTCGPAVATTFQTATNNPFSQYGQIQNVQNYSSNPFWNPNSPYNQRMPVPVYIQGTDIDTSECQTVVSTLVASYCLSHNNCVGVTLNDARPTLTIQLASIPNKNYVTPCSGYIDTEFQKYISSNSVAVPSAGTTVPFPAATTPNTNLNNQKVEFQNPYQPQLPTWNGEPWAQEMLERKQELENLQSANSTANETTLAKADFPKTAADLTFTQRLENDSAGYAPYAGKSAYRTIDIEPEKKYLTRMQNMAKANKELYCAAHPDDETCKNTKTELAAVSIDRAQMMAKIAQALKDAKK